MAERVQIPTTAAAPAGVLGRAHPPGQVAAWREAYLYGILVAAVFLPFDFLYGERLPATLGIRVGLLAVLGACWLLLRRADGRRAGAVVVAGAVVTAIATPLLVVTSSGASGPRFGFLLCAPFVILALLPELPSVAALGALAAAVAGGAALLAARRPVAEVLEWTTLTGVMAGVTAWGARRLSRLQARARAAEAARQEALTRLAASERQREAGERLALVGRLAAGIGHEINNPLTAVKANVLCALEDVERGAIDAATAEALLDALGSCDRLAAIAADMRALAPPSATPLVPCSVAELIRLAREEATGRVRGLAVDASIEPGLPEVRTLPGPLSVALAHLATCAAMGAPVAAAGSPPRRARLTARRRGAEVEVVVEDQGPPIPAELVQRLFEPFAAQGELAGAGLGLLLPLTRELAARSGGRVSAEVVGGANRFTVTLAVTAAA